MPPGTDSALLAELARRLDRVEDELAVHKLLVRYGYAVDAGAADELAELFTEQAVYEIDSAYVGDGAPVTLEGRDALRNMIDGERHTALRPRCAHTIGPLTVEVEGDRARATGYSRVYWGPGSSAELHRLSANEWRCERVAGRWLIAYRRSVSVGSEQAQQLLRAGLD